MPLGGCRRPNRLVDLSRRNRRNRELLLIEPSIQVRLTDQLLMWPARFDVAVLYDQDLISSYYCG